MFRDATNIQIFNTLMNLFSVFGVIIMAGIVWGYKRRVKERYEHINKRLDDLLLLASELYETDVKDKKRLDGNFAEKGLNPRTGPNQINN